FNHAKCDEPRSSRPALVVKKFHKTNWQPKSGKPAIDIAKGDIDVGHTQDKARWLVANFRDEREFRDHELLELVRHKLDLSFREWHKPPILFPRLIVNFAKAPAFFANILEISRPDNDRPALPETFGQWSQTGCCPDWLSKPPRVPIFRFRKTAALDQVPIVRRIMRGQYRGRKLKSINQKTADIVC